MNERYGRDYYDDDDNEGRRNPSDRGNRAQRSFSRGETERGDWRIGRNAQESNYASGERGNDQRSRYEHGRYERDDYGGEFGAYGSDRRYTGGSYARDSYFTGPWRGESSAYGLGHESREAERYDRPWENTRWGRSGDSRRDDDWRRRHESSERTGGYTGSYGSTRQGGFFGKGPKGYVRSDERIREDVCDRLSIDDEVDASDITVSVRDGEVTLEGTVPDRRSKHRAEDIAESVSGVKDIHNSLRPQKGFLKEMGDRVTGRAEAEQHGHSGAGPRNGTSASQQ